MDFNIDPSTLSGAVVCVLFWVSGIITNASRRMKKQSMSFKQYWTVDWAHSLTSLLISIALLILFFVNKQNSVFMYFSAGYIIDSLINKAEAQTQAGDS